MTNTNKNRTGYKETKIGWIPEDWEETKFGDVFEFLRSTSFSRANLTFEKKENGIYNLHYGDIHSTFKREILDFDIEKKIARLIDDEANNNFDYVTDGDLIIADASEDYEGVGKCVEVKNIRNRKVIGGLHTFVARDNSGKTIDGFRCYIFRNPNVSIALKKIATGISVYGISKKNLKNFISPLPPLPEQKKIAEILSSWDTAISKYDELIKKYQLRKKALMQKLLTGKVRFGEFEGQEWKEVRIKDVAKINKSSIKETNDPNLAFYYIDLTSVKNGVINIPNQKLRFKDAPSRARRIIQKHDIIMATVRPNLKGFAFINFNSTEYICSTGFAVITTLDGYNSLFLYHQLFAENLYGQVLNLVVGTNYPAVNSSDIAYLKIPKPSLPEQRKIASVLTAQDKQIDLLKAEKAALKQQKKELMPKLLTGEVRVIIELRN
jgi:type I restriction enzyme, S subunit